MRRARAVIMLLLCGLCCSACNLLADEFTFLDRAAPQADPNHVGQPDLAAAWR